MDFMKVTTLKWLHIAAAAGFSVLMAFLFIGNIVYMNGSIEDLAQQTAEVEFRKDMQYRDWMREVGGLYVQVSPTIQPNPHLQYAEREVVTRSGRTLTLLNPLYLIERVFEQQKDTLGHGMRIVSLDPERNVQSPDAWEYAALEGFKQGETQRSEVVMMNGNPVLRFIKPVVGMPFIPGGDTTQHIRAYRGALSYSIPLPEIAKTQSRDLMFDSLLLGGLWLLGLTGLYLFGRSLCREVYHRIQDQDRFQQVTELSTDLIYILDRKGTIIRANAAFYRHLDRDPVKRAPVRLTDFASGASEEELLQGLDPLFEAPTSFESHHVTANGTAVPVEISTIPVTINDERFLYCTGRDISERKLHEEKVKRSEQLFRQIWEQSAEGMRLTNADGVITKVNDAYCSMVDRSREELEGRTLDSVFVAHRRQAVLDKHRLNFAQHQLQNGMEKEVELWNGERRWFYVSNAYVLTEGRQLQLLGTFRDFTERRRLEEQVRLSQEQLHLVTEHSQDLIYRYEFLPVPRFTYVSPSSTAIIGFTPEEHYRDAEIIQKSIHPEDRAQIREFLESATGDHVTKEMRWMTKDGRTLWAEQKVTIERDAAGRVAAIQGIARDITERKHSEEHLQLQAAALNAAANAIVITDPNGNIEWANPTFETMSGYTLAEAIGKNPSELIRSGIHPASFYKTMWETISAGRPWTGEMINRRKNGPVYVEEMTITPMLGPAGDVKHYIAIKQDVTDRKKIERQLVRDEQKFHSYMDASPLGIFVRDRNGRYEDINPAGVHMFGYAKEELLQETMMKLVDPAESEKASAYYTDVQNNGFGTVELLCRRKDRTPFWVRVNAVRLQDGHIISYAEDITERRNTQQQLQRQTTELETVVANLPGYIYRAVDDNRGGSTLLFVSDGVEKATGFTANELMHSMKFMEHVPPKDLERGWELTRRALKDRTPFELEYPFMDKQGKERWLWERGRGIYADDGRYLYTEGYVMEVTSRRHSELQLFEAVQQNEAMYDQSSVGMLITDLMGGIMRANRHFCEMLGYDEATLRQRTFMDITHPEDLEGSLLQKEEMVSGLRRSVQFEKRYRRSDGSYIWMRLNSVLIRDAVNAPRYFSNIAQDITHEKNITNAVRSLAVHPSERPNENIFDVIVRNLVSAIQADVALIGILSQDGKSVRTLAMYRRSVGQDSAEYPLAGTPCQLSLQHGMQYYADGIIERFPEDRVLEEMGMTSYLGVPLFSSTNNTIGVLVALAAHPIEAVPNFREIHTLFAERTVSELERMEVHDQLRQREDEFRFLVEHAQDVVVRLDTKAQVLYASPSAEQLGGYSAAETIGTSIGAYFVDRNEARKTFRELNAAVQQNEIRRVEFQFRRKDGSAIWVEAIAKPVRLDGERIELHVMLRDISERKRSEEVLQQYEQIISATVDSISLVDDLYRYIVVNDAYARQVDRTKEEIEGRTVAEIFGEQMFEEHIRPHIDRCLAGNEVHYHAWFTFASAGRRYMDVQYLPYHHGSVKGVLVSSRDITEAKEAEDSAIRSEQRFKVVWESSNEAMRLSDEHGTIVMVNDAYCTLVHLTQEELLSKPISVVYPGNPETMERYRRNFAERRVREFFEERMTMHDGREIFVQSSNAFIHLPQGETLLLSVFRDITPRVIAERRLKQNEERYRSLVETMHQGLALHEMIYDASGRPIDYRFIEVNKSFEEMTGLRRDDIIGKRVLEVLPQTEPYWIEQYGAVAISGEPRVMENTAEELQKYFEVVAYSPMKDHFVAIISDITVRRRAELVLQHHEQALAGLSSAAVDLLHMTEEDSEAAIRSALAKVGEGLDADRVYIFRNGTDADGEPVTSMTHEWVMEGVSRELDNPRNKNVHIRRDLPTMWETLRSGRTFSAYTEDLPAAERTLLEGQFIKSIILVPIIAEDEFWGFFGIDAVRTHRRWSDDELALVHVSAESFGIAIQRMTAVAQLAYREEMLKFALDASGDGIWTFTIPTREMFFSDQTKRLVGYDGTESTNIFEYWLEHVHPADRQSAIDAMEQHLTGQTPIFINEHRFLCADGVYRWMLERGKVLKWEKDGRPFQLFGTYSNIHHRKETEDEVRTLNERLEHKVQERTQQLHESMQEMESFSYSISHDLRAPVRAIDSYTKILTDEEEERLGPEGKRLLQNVRANTARMGRMIDDLLQFSRASRAEITKVSFDMQAMVTKVADEACAGETNRTVRVAVGFLPTAFGDPSLLRQVVVNLIANAVKFTRQRAEALIEVGGADADGLLTYWVKDNGTGFDMKYADKLFGVFQRLHNQQEFEGTGVGLAIVHRILQKHGGTIRVESTEDVGTTFTFTIPARPGDSAVAEGAL